MNAKRLLTIAVVSMLLVGGVAALGAATPAEEANDSASGAGDDLPAQAEDAGADDDEDEPETNGEGPGAAEKRGVGPSDGLPEQVPDHVRGIHDRIDSFLGGSIDDLGGSLSDLLGDRAGTDEPADEGASGDRVDADASA